MENMEIFNDFSNPRFINNQGMIDMNQYYNTSGEGDVNKLRLQLKA